ncbi:hypothetical protein AURDEDRAFT_166682 [Auricularia subglabra TFB-10046 SS5]|nr:hypothetical protein AURDEDRAFT_166682 [Auricularia subglabra TFB-10046 SS5]
MAEPHDAALAVLRSWQVIKFTYVCKAALFTYDFVITVVPEANLVWSSGLGLAEGLFYAARYSAWPELCAEMLLWFGMLDDKHCRWVGKCLTGALLSQGVIMLRTWAIWNGSFSFKLFFALVGSASAVTYIYLNAEWIIHTRLEAVRDMYPGMRGCMFTASYRPVWIGWLLFCCNDFSLLFLTVIKYTQNRRRGLPRNPKLTAALYRDAFFYFSFMLPLAVANLTVSLVATNYYQFLLYGMERILYTTLACRIIINLRAAARKPEMTLDLSTMQNLEFNGRNDTEMDILREHMRHASAPSRAQEPTNSVESAAEA